jgi:hypothetical protein
VLHHLQTHHHLIVPVVAVEDNGHHEVMQMIEVREEEDVEIDRKVQEGEDEEHEVEAAQALAEAEGEGGSSLPPELPSSLERVPNDPILPVDSPP